MEERLAQSTRRTAPYTAVQRRTRRAWRAWRTGRTWRGCFFPGGLWHFLRDTEFFFQFRPTRIHLVLALPGTLAQAVDSFRDYVQEQTLAIRLELADALETANGFSVHESRLGGEALRIGIARSERPPAPGA